jgi:hypothetical protein
MGGGLDLAVLGDGGPSVRGDDVDALVDQVGVELEHLLLGDLHLVEAGRYLLEREIAAVLSRQDERPKLLGLRDGRFVREQSLWLFHSPVP